MRQQKPEIIIGDPSLRFRWLMATALYLLVLVWFEPILDFYLKQWVFEPSAEGLAALNAKKQLLATWGFTLLRSLPLLLFLWLGWQVVRSKRLPPPGVRLPFTVHLIVGRKAQFIGMGVVAVALLSLLREVGVLATVLLA